MDDYYEPEPEELEEQVDEYRKDAEEILARFIEENENQEKVFYSRQLEIFHEKQFFHWITNKAVRSLADAGVIKTEERGLRTGGRIRIIWNRKNRYYKRAAIRLCSLVEEFADTSIGHAIGEHAEHLVVGAFSRSQFVQRGEHTREFNGREWTETENNLDYIFERDSVAYGSKLRTN